MSSIWLDVFVRLRGYSATTRNAKSIVKIELETDRPAALGYLLEQLAELDRNQRAAAKPPAKKKTLALPAPLLQIPHFDPGDE